MAVGADGLSEEERLQHALKPHGNFPSLNRSTGGRRFLENNGLPVNELTSKVEKSLALTLAGVIVDAVEPDAVIYLILEIDQWANS